MFEVSQGRRLVISALLPFRAGIEMSHNLGFLLVLIRRQQRIAADLNRRGGANVGASFHWLLHQ
jgi:hypothetical protein